LDEGAVKPTDTLALPMVAGVTELEAEDAAPVPTALVAVTVQVTGVPLVRPVTVIGELVPPALCAPQVAV
jgi:hypothetical protein